MAEIREYMERNTENKNHQMRTQSNQSNEKKAFDKKKYRERKYSNKYKVDQWKERKKKAFLQALYAETRKSEDKSRVRSFDPKNSEKHPNQESKIRTKKGSALTQTLAQKKQKLQSTEEDREQSQLNAQMNEAIKVYKNKRAQTYQKKKLFTKTGQPVMKHRLELMLDKIKMG